MGAPRYSCRTAQGSTAGARAHDVRRELVEHGAVLAVVALPAQMFPGTSIGVCIWLLRATDRTSRAGTARGRAQARPAIRHPVAACTRLRCGGHRDDSLDSRGIGVARPGFSVLAAPDEIRAHGYSLHPPEYQDRTLAPTAADAARAELDALFDDLGSPSYTAAAMRAGPGTGWATSATSAPACPTAR